jgi:hypothetical protein
MFSNHVLTTVGKFSSVLVISSVFVIGLPSCFLKIYRLEKVAVVLSLFENCNDYMQSQAKVVVTLSGWII